MYKAGDWILSGLMGCFVGTVYFLIEVVYKTAIGFPEGISWTMLVLALVIGIVMERMGANLSWRCPIWAQALFCGAAITTAEFVTGCIVNLWLGWGVWDYSNLPGNSMGQICPQFSAIWFIISGPAIVALDWIRYAVRGGEKPYYCFRVRFCRGHRR